MSDEPPRAPQAPSPSEPPRDPDRRAIDIALRLAALGAFVYFAILLVRPFAAMAIWTVVIAAALHPAYAWLNARLGGRPWTAATLVTLGALAVTLGPIATLVTSLVASAEWLAAQSRTGALQLPDPPAAIRSLPMVGEAIGSNWDLATHNLEEFLKRYAHVLIGAGERAALPALRFAEGMAMLVAAVALSGFLHPAGDRLGAALRRATARVAGPRGAAFVDLAGVTIRNVARGVIGVAVVQALLVGVGLILGGVPAAGVLTLAVLVLAIVQIGAWPVVLCILAWMWFVRAGDPSLALAAYLVFAAIVDIPLKPLMLGSSSRTPALVIFAGVVAGVVAYGLIGLFLGPILLAIGYEGLRAMLDEEPGGIA